MKKKWLTLLASTALLTLGACANNTVAKTSAGNITKDEFYRALKQAAGSKVLYNLIVEKVAVASVKDKSAIDAEVNEFIAARKKSSGGEDGFQKLIKQYGYENEVAFRNAVYANRALTKAIENKTTITDEEIAKAYETWTPDITASHILVADEAKANEVIQKLNTGEDWKKLATENSTDKANKDNGGSLGTFKPETMVKEFADALNAMNEGEVSKTPVKTKFGYHIIKLEKKPAKGTLEESKETIRKELIASKLKNQAHQQTVLKEILKDADVEVTEESLKEVMASVLPSKDKATSSDSTTVAPPNSASETTQSSSTSSGN